MMRGLLYSFMSGFPFRARLTSASEGKVDQDMGTGYLLLVDVSPPGLRHGSKESSSQSRPTGKVS